MSWTEAMVRGTTSVTVKPDIHTIIERHALRKYSHQAMRRRRFVSWLVIPLV